MSHERLRFRSKDKRPATMKRLSQALLGAYKNINEAYALSKDEMVDKQALDLLMDQAHVYIEQARELSKEI